MVVRCIIIHSSSITSNLRPRRVRHQLDDVDADKVPTRLLIYFRVSYFFFPLCICKSVVTKNFPWLCARYDQISLSSALDRCELRRAIGKDNCSLFLHLIWLRNPKIFCVVPSSFFVVVWPDPIYLSLGAQHFDGLLPASIISSACVSCTFL